VKVGDIVTYAEGDKRVHSEKIDNENILIMPEDCILGVIEQDKGE
jgi:co-chaperonin GroES (HSP10)